jgi:hypothetical protein
VGEKWQPSSCDDKGRVADQILLKFQLGQSSDQVK